jgi:decaprenyl-phosphate phosphoribosyltransferase
MSISFITVFALPKKSLLILAGYLLMTVLYSLKLKSVRLIEILVVSTGFVLRIWFGASAINVPMSVWLCVSVYSGSTMIVIAKRHAELRMHDPQIVRAVVLKYKQKTLQIAGFITSLGLISSYVLWTLFGQQDTITQRLFLYISCIPFIVGVIKFHHQDRICGVEEPEEFLLSDRTMQMSGTLFLSLLIFGIFVNS